MNDESDDEEDVLEFYSGVMDQLHQRLFQNIEDPSVKKCTKYFAKKIQNGLKGNLPTLTPFTMKIAYKESRKMGPLYRGKSAPFTMKITKQRELVNGPSLPW